MKGNQEIPWSLPASLMLHEKKDKTIQPKNTLLLGW